MKRTLKLLVMVILVVIAAFLIIVAMQPATYRVSRSALISATPEIIFPHVNELRKWDAWSPWAKLDPNATASFDGPESGVGSSMSWAGNQEVGEGRMTITSSTPNEAVQIKLEFFKPMAGVSDVDFSLQPRDGQTEVTWTMSGKNNFVGKAFCLFMSLDTMVGGMYEKGLANLKAIAETPAK